MPTVVKVLELVGESPRDWTDAVQNAVAEAAKTIDHITGVEVANLTANVENGRVVEYKANVKVAFAVDAARRQLV
ncbi:MAG: dodecin domain-containing protein [Clostridia bacterium]|nr:dodecin domain-containing protein [Clostridia bacterium]